MLIHKNFELQMILEKGNNPIINSSLIINSLENYRKIFYSHKLFFDPRINDIRKPNCFSTLVNKNLNIQL